MKYIASWSVEIEAESAEKAVVQAIFLSRQIGPIRATLTVLPKEVTNDETTVETRKRPEAD